MSDWQKVLKDESISTLEELRAYVAERTHGFEEARAAGTEPLVFLPVRDDSSFAACCRPEQRALVSSGEGASTLTGMEEEARLSGVSLESFRSAERDRLS